MYNGATPDSRKNDTSLVVYYNYGEGNSLLLTGDLEKKGVEGLLAAGLPGPVSLLKLPHHGSRFSAIDQLIDRLLPQSCLASVGYQNRYHLPAKTVVGYLQEKNVPLYRTDFLGALQARYSKQGWQIRHWQQGFFVDISP
jgi:competence protein ComEC